MNKDVAHFFRDQLRHARAVALRDAENFEEIVFVFERLGMLLLGRMGDLGKYTSELNQFANRSSLAVELPAQWNEFHAPFSRLYESVRKARNAALHEGAFARHLTTNAIELALIMEDALMDSSEYVSDFMVKNPICASLWQPLSFVRQTMLTNSFSYLPVQSAVDGKFAWKLISDLALSQYLRSLDGSLCKERLGQTLEQAIASGDLKLSPAQTCNTDLLVADVFKDWNGTPILVLSPHSNDVLGILTSFDLL